MHKKGSYLGFGHIGSNCPGQHRRLHTGRVRPSLGQHVQVLLAQRRDVLQMTRSQIAFGSIEQPTCIRFGEHWFSRRRWIRILFVCGGGGGGGALVSVVIVVVGIVAAGQLDAEKRDEVDQGESRAVGEQQVDVLVDELERRLALVDELGVGVDASQLVLEIHELGLDCQYDLIVAAR